MQVRAERQHKENTAEHIFALRNPCDGFHPHRMNRKNRRDKCASPNAAGHSSENQKEEDRSDIMQNDVGEMMAASLQSITLPIRHLTHGLHRISATPVPIPTNPFH